MMYIPRWTHQIEYSLLRWFCPLKTWLPVGKKPQMKQGFGLQVCFREEFFRITKTGRNLESRCDVPSTGWLAGDWEFSVPYPMCVGYITVISGTHMALIRHQQPLFLVLLLHTLSSTRSWKIRYTDIYIYIYTYDRIIHIENIHIYIYIYIY